MSSSQQTATQAQLAVPHDISLRQAFRWSMEQDKPIMTDYYLDSMQGRCRLVKTQDKDTILFKNSEEHTSPLKRLVQIDGSKTSNGFDLLCVSENSIYVVHSNILANNQQQHASSSSTSTVA